MSARSFLPLNQRPNQRRSNPSMGYKLTAIFAVCAAAMSTHCGAKTGLDYPDIEPIPEAGMDTFRDVPFVRYEACVPGRYGLVRRTAEVIFVIDRSGSMDAALEAEVGDGGRSPSRWNSLADALRVSIAGEVETRLSMGALVFPRVPVVERPSFEESCNTNPLLPEDRVLPAFNNSSAILRIFQRTRPRGSTPTYSAIVRAGDILRDEAARDPDRSRARYIILATDGGPNCNEMLDPANCVCAVEDPLGRDVCRDNPGLARWFCLDRDRVVDHVGQLAREGFYTYVVGLDNPSETAMIETLNAVAVAGQRPNPVGDFRYYSIRRVDQLFATFRDIATTIARCAFVTPSRPDDPNNLRVEIGGLTVPRDRAHQNGWDWTNQDYGEITLYGAACTRAVDRPVNALVGCNMR